MGQGFVMGAIFNPPTKMTDGMQAGMFYARKRNRFATAVVDSAVAPAYGTIYFPINPTNGQTITVAGTVITFVSGTPSGAQVKIADDITDTVAALIAYLAENPLATATVTASGNGILVQSVKPADTTVTLAASAATVSGANLVQQQVNARQNSNSLTVLP